jgi:EF hand
MRLAILICAALLIGAAGEAQAAPKPGGGMNETKCKTLWTMVSPDGAAISKDKAMPYVVDFAMVDTDNDGTIDANEFIAGCQAGLVKAP